MEFKEPSLQVHSAPTSRDGNESEGAISLTSLTLPTLSSCDGNESDADENGGAEKSSPSMHQSRVGSEKLVLNETSDTAGQGLVTSTDASIPNTQFIHGPTLYLVTACITMVVFLMSLDTSIITTAIPYITNDFHSLTDVGWYGSAYLLASASLQPLSGKIYSKFSSKWSFLVFFLLFEVGSLICGIANSSVVFIIGRAVAGMGSSGLMNGGLTIIASSAPLEKRPSLTGMLMAIGQLGAVFGPLIGGAFTQYSTWRWCFYINLPIGGLVVIFMVLIQIPDQMKKPSPLSVLPHLHKELDLVGCVLFAPAAVMLLLAFEWGGSEYAWNSATIIGLFCGSGGTFLVWSLWNIRLGDAALIPISMVKKMPVWSGSLSQNFAVTTLYVQNYYLPIYFQAIMNDSPFKSGVNMLPSIMSQLTITIMSGFVVQKLGFPIVFSLVSGIFVAISSGLLSTLTPTSSTGEWAGFQVMAGFGRGLGMQMPILCMQAVLKPSEISTSMSLLMFTQTLGTSVALAVCSTIFDHSLRSRIGVEAPTVSASAVINAGATEFRNIVSQSELPGVLKAYATSVDRVFYLSAAGAVVGWVCAWGMGWVDIRKKSEPKPGQEQT